jgi:hypothetical protein
MLFFMGATLAEHKWLILRKRRGEFRRRMKEVTAKGLISQLRSSGEPCRGTLIPSQKQ